jgi:hypothetical protein
MAGFIFEVFKGRRVRFGAFCQSCKCFRRGLTSTGWVELAAEIKYQVPGLKRFLAYPFIELQLLCGETRSSTDRLRESGVVDSSSETHTTTAVTCRI